MNLYRDAWIPVEATSGESGHATLKELLCSDNDYHLAPQMTEYLELSALKLLIALVQVALAPADLAEARAAVNQRLDEHRYDSAVQPLAPYFDLFDERYPFMQFHAGAGAKPGTSSIQRLFSGFPSGTNPALFRSADAIRSACPSCAAIAIYHAGADAAGYGGSYKDPIVSKGAAHTLLKGAYLRETLWLNVLSEQYIGEHTGYCGLEGSFNWVGDFPEGQTLQPSTLPLATLLFWQSKSLRLHSVAPGVCDCCGARSDRCVTRVEGAKRTYETHDRDVYGVTPYSPYSETAKHGLRALSLSKSTPLWEQVIEYLFDADIKQKRRARAHVVGQARLAAPEEPLALIVGGMFWNQAKVEGHFYEAASFSPSLEENQGLYEDLVQVALDGRKALDSAARACLKALGFKEKALSSKLAKVAPLYDAGMSDIIFGTFGRIDDDPEELLADLLASIRRLARTCYAELASRYTDRAESRHAYYAGEKSLDRALIRLTKKYQG